MASAASELTEPHVLARTKRELFPADADDTGYVVADTQFAQEYRVADRPIRPAAKGALASFDHVRAGSGYSGPPRRPTARQRPAGG